MSPELILFLVVLVPVEYVSNFFHELGHALMAWLNGFEVTSFGLGTHRPFLIWRLGASRIFLCRTNARQGITFYRTGRTFPSRRQYVCVLLGGILANILLALAAFALWQWLPWGRPIRPIWLAVAVVNGCSAIVNALPFTARIGKFLLHTDGGQIMQVLLYGTIYLSPAAWINLCKSLRELWKSIGDVRSHYIYSLNAAHTWLELNHAEHGERLVAEAQSLAVGLSRFEETYGDLVQGIAAYTLDKFDLASQSLDEAEKGWQELGDQEGLFLVSLAKSELLIRQGEPQAALAMLNSLVTLPLSRENVHLRVGLLASRLLVEVSSEKEERRLREEVTEVQRRHPALADNLPLHQAFAQYLKRREDWSGASAAYWKALGIAQKVHEELADAEDQEDFLKCQADLLSEAGECLRRAGEDEKAEKIRELFPTREERERRRAAERRQRDRRYARLGLGLHLFNLVVILGTFAVGLAQTRPIGIAPMIDWLKPFSLWGFYCSLVTLFTAASAAYGLFYITLGRLFDYWRRDNGLTLFLLALTPWVIATFCIAVWYGCEFWVKFGLR